MQCVLAGDHKRFSLASKTNPRQTGPLVSQNRCGYCSQGRCDRSSAAAQHGMRRVNHNNTRQKIREARRTDSDLAALSSLDLPSFVPFFCCLFVVTCEDFQRNGQDTKYGFRRPSAGHYGLRCCEGTTKSTPPRRFFSQLRNRYSCCFSRAPVIPAG